MFKSLRGVNASVFFLMCSSESLSKLVFLSESMLVNEAVGSSRVATTERDRERRRGFNQS